MVLLSWTCGWKHCTHVMVGVSTNPTTAHRVDHVSIPSSCRPGPTCKCSGCGAQHTLAMCAELPFAVLVGGRPRVGHSCHTALGCGSNTYAVLAVSQCNECIPMNAATSLMLVLPFRMYRWRSTLLSAAKIFSSRYHPRKSS